MLRKSDDVARKGFTLVELAVVIVIIGVLAAFGVPRFLKSVERSKAAEAFQYLSAVRAAQERFLAKNGVFYTGTPDEDTGLFPAMANGEELDITQMKPKYFVLGAIEPGEGEEEEAEVGVPTWTMTLTRDENTSSYGAYTVVFTQNGYDADNSGIEDLPEINPMGSTTPAEGD